MIVLAEQNSQWKQIGFRHAIVDWCLRKAQAAWRGREREAALGWNSLAAYTAGWDCVPLVAPEIEANLLQIAASLPIPAPVPHGGSARRWLHVLSDAFPYGGHTAMVWRWIEADSDNCHSVVLLDQHEPIPEKLAAAVKRSGGELISFDPSTPLLEKAARLREHAYATADVVVLSIWHHAVVPTVAFGVRGGPPVLLVNQAAQVLWVGASVADGVLNVTGSDTELTWTCRHRGIGRERSLILPIPLPREARPAASLSYASRRMAKLALGVPADSRCIITVGNSFKYRPLPGIDFMEAAAGIAARCPDAHLLAVGVEEDQVWKGLSQRTGGRMRAVGRQSDVGAYHSAADLYLEGFPYGSTTALLETALQGIACLPAPACAPPPFTTDGIALKQLIRTATVEEYVTSALELLDHDSQRSRYGEAVQRDVEAAHCGQGWLEYLQEVKRSLPPRHGLYEVAATPAVPERDAAMWSAFVDTMQPEDWLLNVYRRAWNLGLRPVPDRRLLKAAAEAGEHRNVPRLLDAALRPAGWLAGLMPGLVKPGSIDRLFYYLRKEGRISRCLTRTGLDRLLTLLSGAGWQGGKC